MKYLIFGTLAILLILSQTTLAQQWEELDPSDVANSDSSIARDLLDVSIAYVKQKGKFESTKAPFPGDYYKGGYDDTKYERRNTSTVTYYRYNFLLEEEGGNATVNATTIVTYYPSNSNFKVINYSYHIDYNGNEDQTEEETEGSGVPVKSELVDTRTISAGGGLEYVVTDSFNSVITDHIESGSLPEANYTIQFTYGAYSVLYEGDEGTNEEEVVEEQDDEEIINEEEEGEEQPVILIIEESTKDEEENGEEEVEGEAEGEGEGEGETVEEEGEGVVDDEEASGSNPGYKYHEVWLKVKSSLGKYYLIVMNIYYTRVNGELLLDKSRTWADIELHE